MRPLTHASPLLLLVGPDWITRRGTLNALMVPTLVRRTTKGDPMDRIKDIAEDAGDIGEQLDRLSFPIGKAELIHALEQRGVPDALLSRLREDNTNSYQDRDTVMSRLGAKD